MEPLKLTGNNLTLENIEEVARFFREVSLSTEAVMKVQKARSVLDRKTESDETFYGINTGFGDLCNVKVSNEDMRQLQVNLIRSHAAGVGSLFPKRVVRAAMLVRINSLIQGNSGVSLEVVELLVAFLNKKIHPCIPCQGSVGASGDLAPLAHMVLPLIGEGEVIHEDEKISGGEALEKNGLKPVVLKSKEGLALINGTAVMTGIGVLALLDAERLVKMADISGAMCVEALKGVEDFLRPEIHEMRPHKGQKTSASNMRKIVEGSGILREYRDSGKVQDAYAIRCMPQVHGASRDSFRYVREVLEVEINSVTDNPLIVLETEEILSGGNFHGQPVALAMDFLSIGLSEIANIAQSRISRLINSRYSDLPAFLVEDSGLNSGFMIAQYTAAALVSENKVLAHPASVDSIPTCAGQEDHVSMGTIAARNARAIVKNVTNVIAIEFLGAVQGLDFLDPLKSSKPLEAVRELIRSEVPHYEKDRRMDLDIRKVYKMVRRGTIIEVVEEIVGDLG